MPIDIARYHGWQGRRRPSWWAVLAIVRVALLQVFRRKSYWLVLLLGLAQFLVFWVAIYIVTQANPPPPLRQTIFRIVGFSPDPQDNSRNGYMMFMERQGVVTMLLLAFSGSLLVGGDFRLNSLAFYLSRRVDRRHYIAGKLLAVAAVVSLLTTLPALVLFVEYGMFTSSFDYWRTNWRVPLGVLAYGGVLAVVLSTWLVSLSAWLERTAPIAVTWASLFLLLVRLRQTLISTTHNESWALIDPWRDMYYVGRLAGNALADDAERSLAWRALVILAVACAVALAALVRRVRAVEVVT